MDNICVDSVMDSYMWDLMNRTLDELVKNPGHTIVGSHIGTIRYKCKKLVELCFSVYRHFKRLAHFEWTIYVK